MALTGAYFAILSHRDAFCTSCLQNPKGVDKQSPYGVYYIMSNSLLEHTLLPSAESQSLKHVHQFSLMQEPS